MNIDIIPLVSFVVITTFTPGPNNISSASMGILYGYRKTLNYLLGIGAGFFIVMICCAYLSSTILTLMPGSEKYLRWAGALYIVWLALSIMRAHNALEGDQEASPKAFVTGFLLQLLNPKAVVYGLTLFSTFLAPVAKQPGALAGFALILALTAFTATSTWALCGAAIKIRLKNEPLRRKINLFLSLLLIYTAIDLSGIVAVL